MPRPNAARDIYAEGNLARRVAAERDRRGWTYEGLAKRLADVGCPINASAIYKIEKMDPPRRITVDELVGFSKVFDVPVDRLLMPPEAAEREALLDLLTEWELARRARDTAVEAEGSALEAVKSYAAEHPELEPALQKMIRSWAESWAEDPDLQEAWWMHTFTRSEKWGAAAKAQFDKVTDEALSRG